jgi:membrane fusion protein (multidrug efflux system)
MRSSPLHLAMVLVSTALLAACGSSHEQNHSMPPAQVKVMVANAQNVPLRRDLVGRLSAHRSADVRARVSGIVLKRTYREGTEVKKGQILFRIDPAPLRASLDAAKASLAQANATYTNNHIAAERARKMAPKGYISQSDLDNAEAAERSSAAAVQLARASVQSARINLGYATVRSPIDGRAGKQQVTEGALVGQGSATLLTTVDQIDPLYVNFTMAIGELDKLRKQQTLGHATLDGEKKSTVRLTLPTGDTYDKVGTVDFSGTSVDPNTGSVQLRATIANPDHVLLPGMYVPVVLTMGHIDHAFLIPESAVQRNQKSAYVMVAGADGKAHQISVMTAGNQNHDWIVTSGIKDGDKVIVGGLANVHDGAAVKIASGSGGQTPRPVAATTAPAASAAKKKH